MTPASANLRPKLLLTFLWCRNTLGEFRRTHEEAGLTEVKKLLTSDQWDAIQDVSSPATYFV